MASKAYLAGETIHRARFVQPSTTADNTVLLAGANAEVTGISQLGGRRAPQSSNSNTTEAALVGEYLDVTYDDISYIECGDTVAAGDRLKSDANGKAIPIGASAGTYNVGAIAQAAGSSGTIIPVLITRMSVVVT